MIEPRHSILDKATANTRIQETYFQSIHTELLSLKNRVREVTSDPHWLTDGEWKESVLRTILRRHLPATVSVGRGFIIGPKYRSTQIDLLLYHSSKPVLFRDGDLVFVTPEAVAGVIEVKTTLTMDNLAKALDKMAVIGELIRPYFAPLGMFAYESDVAVEKILPEMKRAANGTSRHGCEFFCAGSDCYVEWFELGETRNAYNPDTWKRHSMKDMAAGYFLHKVVRATSLASRRCEDPDAEMWFPEKPLSSYFVEEIAVNVPPERLK
jgi:hypothetical protein